MDYFDIVSDLALCEAGTRIDYLKFLAIGRPHRHKQIVPRMPKAHQASDFDILWTGLAQPDCTGKGQDYSSSRDGSPAGGWRAKAHHPAVHPPSIE
jgi:hypothetical protein